MKTNLESEDIEAIAAKVIERIRPLMLSHIKPPDAIMDKKDLSEYLHIPVSWIDRNIYELPRFKVGKYIRFKQSQVDKWIKTNEKTSASYLKLLKTG